MRLLIDMVAAKNVDEALVMLKFTASPHARIVAKLIQNSGGGCRKLHIIWQAQFKNPKIYSDEAMILKRYKARSRHRVSPIQKRSSHITVVVGNRRANGT